ncbi:hypothetical protein BC829DRAFT_442400 [Chytridium lagenaria]|nr:hypothetical protein BC829DRAFT_442400 [Chytridium lagenaria]
MTVDVKISAGVADGVVDVAIIGAGIAIACNLKMKGIHNFVIFEKSGEAGGCWFEWKGSLIFAGVMEHGRNGDAIMFYGTDVSFLGIFAREVMYTGVVMMLWKARG